jgi:hypothetical protein
MATTMKSTKRNLRELGLGVAQDGRHSMSNRVAGSVRQPLQSLLEQHSLQEFTGFLASCPRHSIFVSGARGNLRLRTDREAKEWAAVQRLLPSFQSASDSTRAVAEFVAELVRLGFLGFVQSHEGTRAVYCYPLRRVALTINKQTPESTRKVREDASAPFGQRVEYRTGSRVEGRSEHTLEEHVHHLENVTETPLTAFVKPVPERVAALIRSVPEWLRPSLRVIEGDIVQEEVHRRGSYETKWETEVAQTWKASPAIALGDLVLVGWSQDDLAADRAEAPSSNAEVGGGLLGPLAIGTAVSLFVPGGLVVRVGLGVAAGLLSRWLRR